MSSKTKAKKASAAKKAEALEPLPQPGEVIAHEGLTLIEVSDPAELSALMLDSRLKQYILLALSPTEALVLPQHSKTFISALVKAGHTPKVEN